MSANKWSNLAQVTPILHSFVFPGCPTVFKHVYDFVPLQSPLFPIAHNLAQAISTEFPEGPGDVPRNNAGPMHRGNTGVACLGPRCVSGAGLGARVWTANPMRVADLCLATALAGSVGCYRARPHDSKARIPYLNNFSQNWQSARNCPTGPPRSRQSADPCSRRGRYDAVPDNGRRTDQALKERATYSGNQGRGVYWVLWRQCEHALRWTAQYDKWLDTCDVAGKNKIREDYQRGQTKWMVPVSRHITGSRIVTRRRSRTPWSGRSRPWGRRRRP